MEHCCWALTITEIHFGPLCNNISTFLTSLLSCEWKGQSARVFWGHEVHKLQQQTLKQPKSSCLDRMLYCGAVKMQHNRNVKEGVEPVSMTGFISWSMPLHPSHNIWPNFRDFYDWLWKNILRGQVCSSPVKKQLQDKDGGNCDSLVFRVSNLKSGTLRQSTKRCSYISPQGGHVISVFSAGNCKMYLEVTFLHFVFSPPHSGCLQEFFLKETKFI